MEKILNSKEAASYLGIGEGCIRRYCRQGRIVSAKIGRGWFIKESNLVGFINSETEKTQSICNNK